MLQLYEMPFFYIAMESYMQSKKLRIFCLSFSFTVALSFPYGNRNDIFFLLCYLSNLLQIGKQGLGPNRLWHLPLEQDLKPIKSLPYDVVWTIIALVMRCRMNRRPQSQEGQNLEKFKAYHISSFRKLCSEEIWLAPSSSQIKQPNCVLCTVSALQFWQMHVCYVPVALWKIFLSFLPQPVFSHGSVLL